MSAGGLLVSATIDICNNLLKVYATSVAVMCTGPVLYFVVEVRTDSVGAAQLI